MQKPARTIIITMWTLILIAAVSGPATGSPTTLLRGSDYSGIVCVAVSPDGQLWVSEGFRNKLMRMDPDTGEVLETLTDGVASAADIIFDEDGTMYWVNAFIGQIWKRRPGSQPQMLADFDVVVDGLALDGQGRLYTSSFCNYRATWEISTNGMEDHRMVAQVGGFDAFDIGPDGYLYGPEFQDGTGNIRRVDLATGESQVFASGFLAPSSLRFSPDGELHVLDSAANQVVRIDIVTGAKTVVAEIPPGADNFAFSPDGEMFIAFIGDAFVGRVRPDGRTTALTRPGVACPGGIALRRSATGEQTLFVADAFAVRLIEPQTGRIKRTIYPGPIVAAFSLYDDGTQLITSNNMFSQIQVFDPITLATTELYFDLALPLNAIRFQGDVIAAEMGTGSVVRARDHAPLVTGLEVPVGLASSGDELWVGDWQTGCIWHAFDEHGPIDPAQLVASGLDRPEGMTVAPDGSLLVVETGRQRLVRIDLRTGAMTQVADQLEVGLPASPGLAPPGLAVSDVAVASDGTIYVTGDLGNVIYRIAPERPGREARSENRLN